jgi:hypothetical protein
MRNTRQPQGVFTVVGQIPGHSNTIRLYSRNVIIETYG